MCQVLYLWRHFCCCSLIFIYVLYIYFFIWTLHHCCLLQSGPNTSTVSSYPYPCNRRWVSFVNILKFSFNIGNIIVRESSWNMTPKSFSSFSFLIRSLHVLWFLMDLFVPFGSFHIIFLINEFLSHSLFVTKFVNIFFNIWQGSTSSTLLITFSSSANKPVYISGPSSTLFISSTIAEWLLIKKSKGGRTGQASHWT